MALRDLAKRFSVCRIRFEPLLSTAGIARSEDGFEIRINVEAVDTCPEAGTAFGVDEEWPEFEPRLRFAVAHEIAHAMFFDLHGNWKGDVFRRHSVALENACNEIARALLIPADALASRLENPSIEAMRIPGIVKLFCVSPEVFVRRLQLSDIRSAFDGFDGIAAYVREEGSEFRVVASQIWGPQALPHFGIGRPKTAKRPASARSGSVTHAKRLPEGRLIREVVNAYDLEKMLREQDQGELTEYLPCGAELVLPCRLTFSRISKHPISDFVVAEITGPPEKEAKRRGLLF